MPPANRNVAPGDSIAYRQFKEGLVVWVRYDTFPWWPGVIKRRKPSDAQRDRDLRATGISTRPVEFFNDQKSRSVIDIDYIKEYTENFQLISNAATVKDGIFARDIIAACEEANAFITRHGAHAFQRNAVAAPGFVAPLRALKLQLAGSIPVVPAPARPASSVLRKRTRAATAKKRVDADVPSKSAALVTTQRTDRRFIAARDLQPINTLPSKKRMRAGDIARYASYSRRPILQLEHDKSAAGAGAKLAARNELKGSSAEPATSGDISTSNTLPNTQSKPWTMPSGSSGPLVAGLRTVSPVTPAEAVEIDPRSRRQRAASAEARRRMSASHGSDSLSVTEGDPGDGDGVMAVVGQGGTIKKGDDIINGPKSTPAVETEAQIRFNEERKRFNDERKRFNDERQRFNFDRQAYMDDRVRAYEEQNRLQEERERAREEAQRLRDDLQRLRDEVYESREQTASLLEREREMQGIKEDLRKEKAGVVAELRKQRDKHPALAEEYAAFYAERKSMEDRLGKLTEETDLLREESRRDTGAAITAREELRDLVDEKREGHDSIRASYNRLMKSCEDLQKTRDMLWREIAALEKSMLDSDTPDEDCLKTEPDVEHLAQPQA